MNAPQHRLEPLSDTPSTASHAGWIQQRWAFAPILLLSGTVCGSIVMVTLSQGLGHATAAEPDAYRKAAAWDDRKQQLAKNGTIGWIVTPEIVRGRHDVHGARLELAVTDKHGVAIDDAVISIEMFAIRAADTRVSIELEPTGAGKYGADIPMRISGQWEIRTTIRRGGQTYFDQFRRHIAFANPKESSQ